MYKNKKITNTILKKELSECEISMVLVFCDGDYCNVSNHLRLSVQFSQGKRTGEKIHAQKEQQEIEEESGALVEADGEAMKEDCYYLMEVNGYVVVYLSDKVTPYEYTAIAYDELPPTVRAEVRNGKYIESPEELYGFLENYSS